MASNHPTRRPKSEGGNLVPGAGGGNNGGGRPPSAIRARLRGLLDDRIRVLEEISSGKRTITEQCPNCGYEPDGETEKVSTADVLRSIDITARYAMGASMPLDELRRHLEATVTLAETMLDAETANGFIMALSKIWKWN